MNLPNIPQLSAPLYVDAMCNGFCTVINNQTQMELLHTHDYYEIFLITSGTAVHYVNGTHISLGKGALVFTRPTDCHCYLPPISSDFCLINLILTKKLITEILNFLGNDFQLETFFDCANPPWHNLSSSSYEPLCARLNRLMIFPKENIGSYNAAYKLAAIDIISHFFFSNEQTENPAYPGWLNQLITKMYLPQNYTKGLPQMYLLANCTPEHLCRTFRKYIRQSPTQFINNIKLDEAARKLIYTDKAIIDLAEEIGFQNLSHFYHLFHDRYQMSPSNYRKYSRLSPVETLPIQ